MCYNKETSLAAFTFGIIFTFLLLQQKKYGYALFNTAIVSMQLLEFFGHLGLQNNNKMLIQIIAFLILTLVFLQPILYHYSQVYLNHLPSRNTGYPFALLLFIFIYVVNVIYLWSTNGFTLEYFNKSCMNYCRMNWSFFGKNLFISIPFFIMYFALFNIYGSNESNRSITLFFVLGLVLAILYMIVVDRIKGLKNYYSGFASIWCIFSILYGPVAYFYG